MNTGGLDPNVWAGLRALPPDALVDTIDAHLHQALAILANLRRASRVGDLAEFRMLVRQLKDSSASLGDEPLRQLCDTLAQQSQAGTLTDLVTATRRLEAACGRGVYAMEEELVSLLKRNAVCLLRQRPRR